MAYKFYLDFLHGWGKIHEPKLTVGVLKKKKKVKENAF